MSRVTNRPRLQSHKKYLWPSFEIKKKQKPVLLWFALHNTKNNKSKLVSISSFFLSGYLGNWQFLRKKGRGSFSRFVRNPNGRIHLYQILWLSFFLSLLVSLFLSLLKNSNPFFSSLIYFSVFILNLVSISLFLSLCTSNFFFISLVYFKTTV